MNKGIWAIIVAVAFVGGTISANPIAEAANPLLEAIQATVNDIETDTNNIQTTVNSIETDTNNIQDTLEDEKRVVHFFRDVLIQTGEILEITSEKDAVVHICSRGVGSITPNDTVLRIRVFDGAVNFSAGSIINELDSSELECVTLGMNEDINRIRLEQSSGLPSAFVTIETTQDNNVGFTLIQP